MCSVTASHAKHPGFDSRCPHNRRDWWHSPVTLLLGDKDMEWLEKSSLNALLVSWIHIDVDFKPGLCYIAGKSGTAMIQTA